MATLVRVTQISQTGISGATASIQIDFTVLGILPDIVQIFASGVGGGFGQLIKNVDMSPPEIDYSETIELAAGGFFNVHLCPRTATQGVLDDKIDGQPWEIFCSIITVTTSANIPPTTGKQAPIIVRAIPEFATLRNSNRITIFWSAPQVFAFFQVLTNPPPLNDPSSQFEIDSSGNSGSFTAEPTIPGVSYTFAVNGCDRQLFGQESKCSGFGPSFSIQAISNSQSLRSFLVASGIDPSTSIQSLGATSVRALLKL
jgi:hypothetical protein